MENLKEQKVGNLVAEDYRYADVFKKHHIDFCCGGGISIEEASKKSGTDLNILLAELEALDQGQSNDEDPQTWSLDKLVDHIVDKHHQYVRENMPYILAYAEKVAKVHGGRHPEVVAVFEQCEKLAEELFPHLNKEEQMLFPYIKSIASGGERMTMPFGSVQNPITAMMHEHDVAGDITKEIYELTDGYTPPEDACTTYRVLFRKLADFENDLQRHIHLENNILFPKAIALEAQLVD